MSGCITLPIGGPLFHPLQEIDYVTNRLIWVRDVTLCATHKSILY